MTDSHGLPLSLFISMERRLTRVEIDVDRLKETTAHKGRSQTWSPRDYILAISGGALVTAAYLDKVPGLGLKSARHGRSPGPGSIPTSGVPCATQSTALRISQEIAARGTIPATQRLIGFDLRRSSPYCGTGCRLSASARSS